MGKLHFCSEFIFVKMYPNISVSNSDSPFNQMTAREAPKSFSIIIGQKSHKILFPRVSRRFSAATARTGTPTTTDRSSSLSNSSTLVSKVKFTFTARLLKHVVYTYNFCFTSFQEYFLFLIICLLVWIFVPLYAAHAQGPESDNEAEEEYAVSPKIIRYIISSFRHHVT